MGWCGSSWQIIECSGLAAMKRPAAMVAGARDVAGRGAFAAQGDVKFGAKAFCGVLGFGCYKRRRAQMMLSYGRSTLISCCIK